MIAASIVLFVLAVVVVGTTVFAAGGVLRLNRVAGIRVHYFVVSQESWEAGHAAALLPVTIAGVLAVVGGFVCLMRSGSVGVLVVTYILFFALVSWGIVRGDRAALDAVAESGTVDPDVN